MSIDRTKIFEKVLVTGIAGSGGSYLAERILLKYPQSKLFGLYRSHTSSNSDNLKQIIGKITLIPCELRDFANLDRILREINPTVIFNVASQANVLDSFTNTHTTLINNIEIMSNLLEILRNSNSDTLLIQCSTSEVYGKVLSNEVPISENQILRPSSPYSVSKITQDILCDVYSKAYGLKIIKTRMFTYINPRRADLFAPSFAKQIAGIEQGLIKVLKHGNLDSIRTILDIRDAMDAYIVAAEKCLIGETYNIGGNEVMTVGDFLAKMILKSTVQINTELDPSLLRPIDVTLQIPNDQKFRVLTGWRPRYTVEESIEYLLEFWRRKQNIN